MITTGAELAAAIAGGLELPTAIRSSEITPSTALPIGQLVTLDQVSSGAAKLEAHAYATIPRQIYPEGFFGTVMTETATRQGLITCLAPAKGSVQNSPKNFALVVPFEADIHEQMLDNESKQPRTVAGIGFLFFLKVNLPTTRESSRSGVSIRLASYRGMSLWATKHPQMVNGPALVARVMSFQEGPAAMMANDGIEGGPSDLVNYVLRRMYTDPDRLVERKKNLARQKGSASS